MCMYIRIYIISPFLSILTEPILFIYMQDMLTDYKYYSSSYIVEGNLSPCFIAVLKESLLWINL